LCVKWPLLCAMHPTRSGAHYVSQSIEAVEICPCAFTFCKDLRGVHYGEHWHLCSLIVSQKCSYSPIMHSPECIIDYVVYDPLGFKGLSRDGVYVNSSIHGWRGLVQSTRPLNLLNGLRICGIYVNSSIFYERT
jgi:hypothetical protein